MEKRLEQLHREMVYTLFLKNNDLKSHAGSTPAAINLFRIFSPQTS